MHRNANLVTQKQQEKVKERQGLCCRAKGRLFWLGSCPTSLLSALGPALPCQCTRALLHLPSLPQFRQLFLKLAQTKSALEDSGERGDEACWLRFGDEGSTSGGRRRWAGSRDTAHRSCSSSEMCPEVQEVAPALQKAAWLHHGCCGAPILVHRPPAAELMHCCWVLCGIPALLCWTWCLLVKEFFKINVTQLTI